MRGGSRQSHLKDSHNSSESRESCFLDSLIRPVHHLTTQADPQEVGMGLEVLSFVHITTGHLRNHTVQEVDLGRSHD